MQLTCVHRSSAKRSFDATCSVSGRSSSVAGPSPNHASSRKRRHATRAACAPNSAGGVSSAHALLVVAPLRRSEVSLSSTQLTKSPVVFDCAAPSTRYDVEINSSHLSAIASASMCAWFRIAFDADTLCTSPPKSSTKSSMNWRKTRKWAGDANDGDVHSQPPRHEPRRTTRPVVSALSLVLYLRNALHESKAHWPISCHHPRFFPSKRETSTIIARIASASASAADPAVSAWRATLSHRRWGRHGKRS